MSKEIILLFVINCLKSIKFQEKISLCNSEIFLSDVVTQKYYSKKFSDSGEASVCLLFLHNHNGHICMITLIIWRLMCKACSKCSGAV